MARESLFKFPFNFILNFFHAFPINTNKNFKEGLVKAIELINKDKAVVIFPEGTRSKNGKIKEPKPGIGFLVHKTRAPVVPVYISGTYEALPRGKIMIKFSKITVIFGKMIRFDELSSYNENNYSSIANIITNKIKEINENYSF
jgi:1-acyl-sn-glycerol-3-phosphate acyltransferase